MNWAQDFFSIQNKQEDTQRSTLPASTSHALPEQKGQWNGFSDIVLS